MNEKHIRQQIETHAFKDTNGKILRTLNVLNHSERTIRSIIYVMDDVPHKELENSLHYLLESGYIRIPNVKESALLDVMDEENTVRKLVITNTGMELLEGVRNDPSVDM